MVSTVKVAIAFPPSNYETANFDYSNADILKGLSQTKIVNQFFEHQRLKEKLTETEQPAQEKASE